MRLPRSRNPRLAAIASTSLAAALSALAFAAPGAASSTRNEDPMRVLFLSKSSGFEHSSIKREGDRPSHVEQVLSALADQHGFGLEATKDAGRIRADVLSGFDVVVFYTTGDLTERGGEAERGLFAGDGEPPMGPNGLSDLLAWIRGGGGFVGFHCASDTFHSEEGHSEEGHSEEGSVSDYIAMLGGEFDSHGQQFEGLVRVVDADHPITSAAPRELIRLDEWYLFKNFDPERVHVLRVLDSRDEGERQPAYDREPYPIVWTREPGEGRVYYDAQGHREDVWDDPEFQDSVVRALRWAGGR